MERYDNASDAFYGTLQNLADDAFEGEPRGMPSRELIDESFIITDPRDRLIGSEVRNMKQHYAAANVIWNLAQRDDVEGACWWNEEGRRISDDGKTFYGANYGQRWGPYLGEAIELLRLDPDTRRAWVPIWNQQDLWLPSQFAEKPEEARYSRNGKDVPCTVGFWLRRTPDDALTMVTVMRSQSVWGVMPYDLFLFTTMQELIAAELNMELGPYVHTMLSCHTYEREAEKIEKAFSELMIYPGPMNPLPYNLTVATDNLPKMMAKLMEGEDITEWAADPLLQLMMPYAKEKLSSGTRVAS